MGRGRAVNTGCCPHSRLPVLELALTRQDVDVAVLALVAGLIGGHEAVGVILFQSQVLHSMAAHVTVM